MNVAEVKERLSRIEDDNEVLLLYREGMMFRHLRVTDIGFQSYEQSCLWHKPLTEHKDATQLGV